MRITPELAADRLRSHDHGVLSTLHPERGPDQIPVVYAVSSNNLVGIPIDEVKPKTSTRLQRQRNLAADPRACLLAQHWNPGDWSKLWWIRADLLWISNPKDEDVIDMKKLLANRYHQYANEPFADVLMFSISNITGWSAEVPPA